jgi:hypothetical protein
LEKREHELSQRVEDLETRAEKAEAAIATLHKEEKRLLHIGLTLEEIAEFSQKLSIMAEKHNIPPEQLRGRLFLELENFDHALSLEGLITKDQSILEEKERFVAETKLESEKLKTVVRDLKREKASLEASIKNTREKVGKEIEKIPTVATVKINQLEEGLRRGLNRGLLQVRHLQNEAFAVGEDLGQYQEMLRSNEWLNGLRDLVQGDESIDSKQVRVIGLKVTRGALIWLKHNKGNNPLFSSMISNAAHLVMDLEQWRI